MGWDTTNSSSPPWIVSGQFTYQYIGLLLPSATLVLYVLICGLLFYCRSCIVGCYTTEDVFLEKEGIFLLLDLLHVSTLFGVASLGVAQAVLFLWHHVEFLNPSYLQSSPRNMQNVVLGTLLELCDNPKTMSHILAWRGQKSLTTPGLLLQLWRQEEAELGVSRDLYGRISGGSMVSLKLSGITAVNNHTMTVKCYAVRSILFD